MAAGAPIKRPPKVTTDDPIKLPFGAGWAKPLIDEIRSTANDTIAIQREILEELRKINATFERLEQLAKGDLNAPVGPDGPDVRLQPDPWDAP